MYTLVAARQAPGPKQVENSLGTIAEYGAIGAICVLLIIAVFMTIRGWLKEKDNRREDLSKMATAREKDNDALKDLAMELKDHSIQLVMEAKASQNGMTNALSRQENAFDDLNRTVASLQSEQAKTGAAVETLKAQGVTVSAQLAAALVSRP